MSTTITFNIDDIYRKVEDAANTAILSAAEVGRKQAESLLMHNGGRYVSSAPYSPPNFQTGELAGNIVAEGPEIVGPLRARFGTYVKHGRHMEYGVTIRPKNVKAIPVPCNIQARQMLGRIKGASLRTQNLGMFIKNGVKYLGEKTAKKGELKKNGALFVLRTRVVIEQRPWLRPAASLAASDMKARYAEVLKQELHF